MVAFFDVVEYITTAVADIAVASVVANITLVSGADMPLVTGAGLDPGQL